MIKSRTRHEDYKAWDREMDAVTLAFRKGEITGARSQEMVAEIRKKYAGSVFAEDFHYFRDELGFKNFLRQIEPRAEKIEETVIHERAHFETAQRLGARPEYGVFCFYREDHGQRRYGYQPFVHAMSQRPEHVTAIISAPEKLSDHDRALLK